MLSTHFLRSFRRQFARIELSSLGRWMRRDVEPRKARGHAAISRALEPMENRVLFAGFNVTAATPASGTYLPAVPNTLDLDFNANLLFSSVQAGDLTIDGTPATQYTVVNNRKLRFTLPTVGEGLHSVNVASGALKSLQNIPITAYAGSFTVDRIAPTVSSATLTPGQVVSEGTLSMSVTFSETVRPDNISSSIVSLTSAGGTSVSPTSVTYSQSTNTLNIDFPALPGETSYTLNLASGDGKLEDLAGNDLDGNSDGSAGGDYSLTFGVDAPASAFPAPLTSVGPVGSRVYSGTKTGAIDFVNDTDSYTLSLDAGQTLTLVLSPASGLRGTVELIDPSGSTVQASTSASAGASAVVQVVSIDTAGTYTVKVSGFDSTTGTYTLAAHLNAAVEAESNGGASNNDLASAQNLDGSFVSLGGGASRGAVLGSMPTTTTAATFNGSSGQFSGTSTYSWDYRYPSISVPSNYVPTGDASLSLTGGARNAWWGSRFGTFNFYDEGGSLRQNASVDYYNTWYYGRDQSVDASWTVPLSTIQSWVSDGQVTARSEVYSNQYFGTFNLSFPYAATAPASDDFYSFTLSSGQSATVALKMLTGSASNFELIDPNGVKIATSTAGTELDQQVADIVAATSGTYYVKILANASEPTYNLLVTKNASVDAGANDSLAASQDITVSGKAIGALTTDESDFFKFSASAGDALLITTATPADGSGEFANTLDAKLELYDPSGTLVATSEGTAGLNEALSHSVTATGTYVVKISSESSTTGEYTLTVAGYTRTLPAFTVTGTSIANNAKLATVPTQVTVTLNSPFLPGTESASDLTVDGVEATAVTIVDSQTLLFTLPTLTDGDHTIALSADALRNLQGTSLGAFSSTFHLDTTGPTIVSTSISQSGTVTTRGLTYDVTFNEPLKDGQLSADDFSLDAVTSVSSTFYNSDQRYLSNYSSTDYYVSVPSTYTPTGDATVTITANGAYIYSPAYFSDEDGNGRGSWSPGTYYNGQSTSLTVSQADLQRYISDGQFRFRISTNGNYYPYGTFTVAVNFPYTQTTVKQSYTADSASLSADKKTLTLTYSNLAEDDYRLTLKSGDGAFEDALGNDLDGDANNVNGGDAFRNFTVEYDRNAVPVPLTPVGPVGSLAYSSSLVSANIGTTSDVDTWVVTLDAGQRLSAVVEPASGSSLQPAISIFRTFNPSNNTYGSAAGSASATSPGTGTAAAVTTSPSATQTYYIRVSSVSGSGTTGAYTLRALANTVYERERLNPSTSSNDTIGEGGTAQSLDGRFTSLGGSSNAGITNVLGQIPVSRTTSSFYNSDQRYLSNYSSTDYYVSVPSSYTPTGDATVTITANGAYIYNPAYFSDEDGNGRGNWNPGTYYNGQSTSLTVSQADLQRYISDGQFRFRISTNGNYYPYGTFTVAVNFPYETVNVGSVDNYSVTLDAGDTLAVSLEQLTGTGAGLEIFDSAGVRVTTGILTSGTVDRATTSLVSTGGGTYYIRVSADASGSTDLTYALQAVRNAVFDVGGNDSIGTAADISTSGNIDGTARVVGHASGTDTDFYKFGASAGDQVVVGISTPASGSGEFVNTLSPTVEALDAAGNVLASHTGAGSSILSFGVPTDGTYYIRVSAAGITSGEYSLAVGGYSLTLPDLTVTDISIGSGEFLKAVPTTVDVSFSGSLDLSTVNPTDLTVDNVSATAVSIVDGDTVRFTLPTLGQGAHTIQVADASMTALNGVDLTGATRSFTIDLTPPRVVSTSITSGQLVPAGAVSLVVTFDEPIKNGTALDASDLSFVGTVSGAVTPDSIVYDGVTNTLTLGFNSLSGDQTFTLTLNSGAGSFEDRAGNALDGNSDGTAGDNFTLTFGVNAAPTVLSGFTPVSPAGSLVYSASPSGAIDYVGDTDEYTVNLDAGQTVAVVLNPAAGLVGKVELVDASGTVLASATSSSAGDSASFNATAVPAAGVYTLRFSSVSGSTGAYSGVVYLNAALESENHAGASNDTIGSAQNLDGSFLSVGQGVTQVSVLGGMPRPTAEATYSYSYQAYLSNNYYTNARYYMYGVAGKTATGPGTVTIRSDGVYNNGYAIYAYNEDGSNTTSFVPPYYGSYSGQTWTFQVSTSDINRWASDDRIDFRLDNQYYNPYGTFTLSLAYPYQQTVESTPDTYAVTLSAGQSASVALKQLSGSGITMALFDANGVKVVDATTPSAEVDSAITDFVAPSTGTYYLKVTPTNTSQPTYNLTVSKNSTFDVGANDSIETAQDVTLSGRASGAIGAGESDFYKFQAKSGDALTISTSTFASGEGEFGNTLDATLELFDAAGNSLGTASAEAGNETLTFDVTADGTYFVKVASSGDTTGEYVVNVTGATGAAPAFLVATTSLTSGAQLNVRPTTFTVELNHAYNPGTIDASDLVLTDAIGTVYNASAVTQVGPSTLEFALPTLPDGDYTVDLAAGSIKDLQGTDLSAHSLTFHLDTTGPLVTSTSIPSGGTHGTRNLTYTVTFNEDINPANIDPSDFALQSFEQVTATYSRTLSISQYYDPANGNGNINSYFDFNDLAGKTPTGPANLNVYGNASWYRSYYTNSISNYYDESGNQIYGYPWNYWTSSWSWNSNVSIGASQLQNWAADGNAQFRFYGYNSSSNAYATLSFPYQQTTVKNSYTPAFYSYDEATRTLTLEYADLVEDNYKLTLKSGDGQFEDVLGNDLDGDSNGTVGGDFTTNFSVEYTSNPLLGAFTQVAPAGSLVYENNGTTNLVSSSDTDDYTILLDAGQTITVVATPVAGLTPTVAVLDASGTTLGSATASGAGQKAVVQTAPAYTAGEYTVRLGSADGAGNVSFKVYLNTAVESENLGGADNSSAGSAQDLDGSFVSLGGSSSKGSVFGGISFDQVTSTYSRQLNQYISTYGGQNAYFDFNDVGNYAPTGPATINFNGSSNWYYSYNTISQTIFYNDETGATLYNYPWNYWQSGWSYNTSSQIDQSTFQSMAADGNARFRYYGFNQSGTAYATLSFPYTNTVVGSDDYYKFTLEPGQSAQLSLKLSSGSGVSFDVLGENGNVITSAVPSGTDEADLVTSAFKSTAGGTFYVRVKSAGTSAIEYALVATKSATFDTGNNDSVGTAQDLTLTGKAVGQASSSDSDFFKFDAVSGDNVVLSTGTPGDAVGDFVNTFDPVLELIDSDGTTVLQTLSGTAERNESFTFAIPATGTYFVRVSSENSTSGEYTVSVTGATPTLPALEVSSASIDDGSFTNSAPTTVTIGFNRPLNLATLSAAALTLDGTGATDFTYDSATNSVTFTLPSYGEGVHTLALTDGSITDLNGTTLSVFSRSFTYETVGPKVVSTTIASGELVSQPDFNLSVTFDEAIRGADLDNSDFVLNGTLGYVINPTTVTYDESTLTATLSFAGVPEDDFTLVVRSGSGAVVDLAGNALDGNSDGSAGDDFTLGFTVDHTTTAFPTLTRLAPAGGQIYTAAVSARIVSGDVGDDYTLSLDAGQLLTVSVLPTNGSLLPTVELYDPSGALLGQLTASSTGLGVSIKGTPISETGTYTVRVLGDSGTTGNYALHAYLNASDEEESYNNTPNGDLGSAQNLDTSVADFRASVVGTLGAGDVDVFVTSQDPGQSLHITLGLSSGVDGTLELLDSSGRLLATGRPSSDGLARSLTVVLPSSGNYFVRVTGVAGDGRYTLIAQSDGTIESEPNDTPETAVDLNDVVGVLAGPGTGRALGFIDTGDTDLYRFVAAPGDVVSVVLSIPGAEAGEFTNNLDGAIEILDAGGNVVATSSGSTGSEAIEYTVPADAGGTFFVRVTGENGTSGEYDLQLAGVTKTQPTFYVQSLSISDGTLLTSVPTQLTVTFNEDIFPYTIDASDLTVDGGSPAASGVTIVDRRTITFDLNPLADGVHTFELAGASIVSRHNIDLPAFTSQFTIDQVGPTITSTSIAPNDLVASGDVTLTAQLSEAIRGGNLSTDDFVLVDSLGNTYGPTSISYADGSTQLDLIFSSLPGERTYTLTIRSATDAVQDLAGNTLDGNSDGTFGDDFTLGFRLNDAAVTFPALTKLGIDGTTVYTGTTSSTIDFDGDPDDYTLNLDANQTLSIVLSGTTSLRGQIELIDPSGSVIQTVTASQAGKVTFIQTQSVSAAGVYTVRVTGVDSTLGEYTLTTYLNAAVESENQGGADDNTFGNAQDLDGSFVTLPTGGAITTVVGAKLDTTTTGTYDQTTTVYMPGNYYSYDYSYFYLDAPSDKPASGPGTFYLSHDGQYNPGYTVYSYDENGTNKYNYGWSYYQTSLFNFQVSQSDLNNFDNDGQYTFYIRKDYYTSYPRGTFYGRLTYPYSQTVSDSTDVYRFSLSAGQSSTVALKQLTGSGSTVEFFDANNVKISTGVTVTPTADGLIADLVSATGGVFYAKVTNAGESGSTYALSVAKGTSLDAGDNNSAATAQDITVSGSVVGQADSSDDDFFTFSATTDDVLSITLAKPASAGGEFVNPLDAQFDLYSPSGELVASATGETTISYTALETGRYTLKVSAANGSAGEYSVGVTGNTRTLVPFTVTSISIADGASLTEKPTTVTVTLSHPFFPGTENAGDLLVDDVAITSFEVIDQQTLRFTLPTLADGGHTFSMTAGALANLQGTTLSEFVSNFYIDTTGPKVVQTTAPAGGTINADDLTYDVKFDEDMDVGSIDPSDIVLETRTTTSGSYDSGFQSNYLDSYYYDNSWRNYNFAIPSSQAPTNGATVTVRTNPNNGAYAYGHTLYLGDESSNTLTTGTWYNWQYGTTVITYNLSQEQVSAMAADGTVTLKLRKDAYTNYPYNYLDVRLNYNYSTTVVTSSQNPSGVTFDESTNTLHATFANLPEDRYYLKLLSGDGKFQDSLGNDLDGDSNDTRGGDFETNFFVNNSPKAFPATTVTGIAGTQVYKTSTSGTLDYAGDNDRFTIDLDAGQSITVEVVGGSGVTPVVELIDPNGNSLGTATATTAGGRTYVQKQAASWAGTYTVRVADTGSAVGSYSVNLFLNTAFEAEAHGGADNGSIGTAQNIDGAFTTIGGSKSTSSVLGAISYEVVSSTYNRQINVGQYYDPGSNNGNPDAYLNFNDVGSYTPTGPASLRMFGNASWARSYYTNSTSNYYNEDGSQIYGYPWNYWTSSWGWDTTTNIDQSTLQRWSADGNLSVRYYGYNSSSNAYATLSFPYQNTVVGSDDYYSFSADAGQTLSLAVKLASGSGVELSLYDSNGTKIASGAASGTLDQALSNYVVPTTGTYYARVKLTGTEALTYDLSVAKDAVVDNGVNTTPATAQNLNAAGGAIGSLNGTDADHYYFFATSGDTVSISLATPGSDAGEFVNSLAASVRVVDEAGNPVSGVTVDNVHTFTAPSTGKYVVIVESENGTAGEYSLGVSGYTKVTSPLTVTSSSLTTGSYLPTAPTEVTVTFSDTIDLSSVSASDLTINGAPAISLSVIDGQTVKFFLPNLTDGEQTITLTSGTVTALDGAGLSEFTQVFTLDRVAPIVSSTSVEQNGVVPQGPLTLDVVFNEPLFDGGSGIGVEDVTLVGSVQGAVSATAAAYNAATQTLSITFPSLTSKQTFVLTLNNSAFVDRGQIKLDGNNNGTAGDDFTLNFAVRAPAVAFPTPLTSIDPLGGLVYTGQATGNLSFTLDSDDYDLTLDAGQTVTLVMNPAAGLTGKVSLVDYTGAVVATATGAGDGKTVVLQTVATSQGVYTLRFASTSGTGAYTGKLYLNAAVETEHQTGADNSTFTGAQDLDGAFATLGGGTGSRAVVLGSIDLTTTTGTFTASTSTSGRAYNWNYSYPSITSPNGFPTPSGDATFSISGTTYNGYWYTNPGYYYFYDESGSNRRGQSVYAYGTYGIDTSWTVPQSTLQSWISDNQIGSRIEWYASDQNTTYAVSYPYSQTAPGNDDFYKFSLSENEVANIAIKGLSGTSPSIEVYDADQNLITLGETRQTNVDETVTDFVAPATGTYYIKVKGTGDYLPAHNYSVVVTKNASFDVEPNDSAETAQNITLTKTALGHLGGDDSVDFYTFDVGDTLLGGGATDPLRLNLQTFTPGGGTGQFVNNLDVKIELYDPNGVLVSSNDNGSNDRKNAKLGYNVTTPGTYTVRVSNVNGSAGEYVLDAKVVPLTAGVSITPTDGLITTEAAGSDSFTVVLNTQPTDNVTITLTSSNTLEGTIDVTELVFTPEDWNVARTVTVTGVDDDSVDRDQSYTITSVVTSNDATYNGLAVEAVGVVNQDNDAAGVTVTPVDGLTVNETGTSTSFNVVLASKPTADVVVNILSGNTAEVTTSVTQLVFTPETWNLVQVVTVTGVDDDSIDGAQAVTIGTSVTTTDADYTSVDPADVTVTNYDDDVAGITITDTTGLATSEAGATASFSLTLTSRPSENVVIDVSSDNPAEGTQSVSQIVFTPEDWNVAHTVVVTGVDDSVDDGDQTYSISFSASTSGDVNYSGLTIPVVALTNTDDDTAGVTVTPTSLTTTEAGASSSFDVVLTSKPVSDVQIVLTGNDAEGTLSSSVLTFTPDDWNVAQTVTVTGVDDSVDDNDVTYNVSAGVFSDDVLYQGATVASVEVTNLDNDTAGVTVVTSGPLVTSEQGASTSFGVKLNSKPLSNVTISLAGDATEGTLSKSALTFTPENWNDVQNVTVTGVDDPIGDGDVTYDITQTVASTDAKYNGLAASPVSVKNTGDEALDITGPKITKLYVNSSSWTNSFRTKLDASGLGYAVPVGSGNNQLRALPWSNINRISVVFDEAVTVTQADLALSGRNVANYGINGFTYNAATKTATWNLATSIGNDKLYVGVGDSVKDITGNALDGEWANPTARNANASDTFPSGNGINGGDFLFRFNVLPGDFDGNGSVIVTDTNAPRTRLGFATSNASYSVFADLNGSGIIDNTDVAIANNFFGQSLPALEPTAPLV